MDLVATKNKPDLILKMLKAKAVLAPMAGITDVPFRMFMRKFGCRFAFTEMIDINGIVYKNRKSFSLLEHPREDEPLAVQLVGHDPDRFLEVAKICQEKGFKLLDVNAACPARKVISSGKGAALLKEPVRFKRIIRQLVKGLDIPVTVKMRIGWDEDSLTCLEIAKIAEGEGVKSLCVHGRTREQMYKGKADYSAIKEVKDNVSIPVFASGNLFSSYDVMKMFQSTGCDGVFIARGALGSPWIFQDIKNSLKGKETVFTPTFRELKSIVLEHYILNSKYYNDILTRKRMYKHMTWYFKRYKNIHMIMKEYLKVENLDTFELFLRSLCVDERNKLFIRR